MKKALVLGTALTMLFSVVLAGAAFADSAAVLDTKAKATLDLFRETKGASSVLEEAKGLLVFPSVKKAGFGIGGEYGEGPLIIDGESVAYYNTVAASFGFQIGVQAKSIILAFMTDQALENFRNASGWEVGADASVAVIAVGANGSLDTTVTNKPIVAFVFDQKGLMYNLTLEGAKMTKINKK
ncbi:MAG: hypothetical protein GF408_04070 [Candidatus Omnitrophica bacterium]|nr:hypothetical protein [Candidatus Omnitrophota bacterium]